MIVHAKPSPPGTEEKLMNVDAREVDSVCECVCERWRKEKKRVLLYFLLEGNGKEKGLPCYKDLCIILYACGFMKAFRLVHFLYFMV